MKRRTFALLLASGLAGCNTQGNDEPPTTTEQATKPEQTSTLGGGSPTPTTAGNTTDTPSDSSSTMEIDGVEIQREQYSLQEVSYDERPTIFVNRWNEPSCRFNASEVDSIPNLQMATINGERGHMPVRTSRTMMKLLYCYRQLDRDSYLEKAIEISEAYLDTAARNDGALYFPYTMKKGGAGVTLTPPWYSALAQGTSLSAYLRLHEATGKKQYRETADAVYESFRRLTRSTDGPWTAMVDDEGYLWFEEYPHDPPTHVLNGFLTGLWGVYEYWLVTEDEKSRPLLEAAITTIKQYVEQFREPGEVSWYALNRGYRGNEFYHAMHILQLRKLHRITGDPYFKEISETFNEDHPEEAGMRT
ncbi:D-glucuronyl C5-epimerase family protein [Halocatena salina]|uniref:D-glucuronyl C5-epimerase family protein n=1 Tax=Halocatena salina TaxID=2934340 RepID=A0A8U0A0Z6_9EURY|nr:D-glucuronyl C5-epimerase family protein [Halocatena salina]UPM41753.1 D-glucuronyl C5-epimerase family protein [Halocatena salina]